MTSLAGLGIDRRAVSVSLTRRAAGAYSTADATYGEWVPGAPTTTTIMAAIQPYTGRKLEDLPEGARSEAKWLAWSRAELRLDDVIAHGGFTYRVMYIWPRADGGFWRAALGQQK